MERGPAGSQGRGDQAPSPSSSSPSPGFVLLRGPPERPSVKRAYTGAKRALRLSVEYSLTPKRLDFDAASTATASSSSLSSPASASASSDVNNFDKGSSSSSRRRGKEEEEEEDDQVLSNPLKMEEDEENRQPREDDDAHLYVGPNTISPVRRPNSLCRGRQLRLTKEGAKEEEEEKEDKKRKKKRLPPAPKFILASSSSAKKDGGGDDDPEDSPTTRGVRSLRITRSNTGSTTFDDRDEEEEEEVSRSPSRRLSHRPRTLRFDSSGSSPPSPSPSQSPSPSSSSPAAPSVTSTAAKKRRPLPTFFDNNNSSPNVLRRRSAPVAAPTPISPFSPVPTRGANHHPPQRARPHVRRVGGHRRDSAAGPDCHSAPAARRPLKRSAANVNPFAPSSLSISNSIKRAKLAEIETAKKMAAG